jgi:outer membrane lipoprotein-sorting protein
VGAARRWARWAAALALLIALPILIGQRPVHANAESARQVLAQIRASRSVGYSGLVEAHGDLSLPNLPDGGDLAGLVSGTTRLRVWWAGAARQRVDQLSVGGEIDTITDGRFVTSWNSTREEVTHTFGAPPLRIPQAGDLLPPALAQRLTPNGLAVTTQRLPAVRIAGRTALGLRLRPTAATTTVRYVDIDVDQKSGLPLRVAITARGQSSPSFSADFLEISIAQPAASTLTFSAPRGSIVRDTSAADFVADADRYAPFQLPSSLAGLPRTQRVSTLGDHGGAATYGTGYTLLVLLPLQQSVAQQVIRALQPPRGTSVTTDHPEAQAVEEQIPLANVVAVDGGGRAYLLAGTVRSSVLVTAADQLLDNPPPFRPRLQRRRP